MKYIILGSNGQLAREFLKILKGEIFAYDIDKLDITDEKSLKECIDSIKADFIINCAAYNNVDKAESDWENAYKVNSLSIKNISLFSQKYKTKIIHFSTDYVFGGNDKKVPYTEEDKPSPVNKYGKSKLEGEKLLIENYENYIIFRVSWLYGDGTQNFPYKFKLWSQKNKELKISTDEISVPTPTKFVAETVIKALDIKGAWHLCCSGYASRYEWAQKIAQKEKLNVKIIPALQSDFSLPARRPNFSAMDNKKLSSQISIKFPFWYEFYE